MALVVFDLDDTLVDRQAAYHRWAEGFCAAIGGGEQELAWLHEIDHDGLTDRDVWCDQIRSRFGFDEEISVLRPRWHAAYIEHYRVEPDTYEALIQLREAGHHIGIVTNGPDSQQDKIVRNALHEYVDGFIWSDLVGSRKPARRIFDAVADTCGCPLDGGWMIGDSAPADMAGGRTVGLTTIWLHRGRRWADVGHLPDPFVIEQAPEWEHLPDGWRPDHEAGSVSAAVDIVLSTTSPT